MSEASRWDGKFEEIKIAGQKPAPEPDAEVVFAKMKFDSTLLGYLCWTPAFEAISWYPTASRGDTGWSIVVWIEDQLRVDEPIMDIVFRILNERGYFITEMGRDLHMNIASDAAIDRRL